MNPVDTIIRDVKMSLTSIYVDDGNKRITIKCANNKFDPYVVHASVSEKNTISAVASGEDNVRELLKKVSPKAIEIAASKIKEENLRYYNAKARLIQLALKISEGPDLIKLLQFIDKVCVSYRYVGNRNRIYIKPNVHLRLADDTGWDSHGKLHLQKVVTIDGGNMTFHDYPDVPEEDLLEEVISAEDI